jgi:hypothetical protein
VNEALMILRKKKRANEQSIYHILPIFDTRGHRLADSATKEKTSESVLNSKQTVTLVRKSISELPDAEQPHLSGPC